MKIIIKSIVCVKTFAPKEPGGSEFRKYEVVDTNGNRYESFDDKLKDYEGKEVEVECKDGEYQGIAFKKIYIKSDNKKKSEWKADKKTVALNAACRLLQGRPCTPQDVLEYAKTFRQYLES
jgi:hypothetical protein